MRAQAVGARRPRGILLLAILAFRRLLLLLLLLLLALWYRVLSLYIVVSLGGLVIYCQRLSVSLTHRRIIGAAGAVPEGLGDVCAELSTDGCEILDFLPNSDGIAECREFGGRLGAVPVRQRQRWSQL